MRILVTGATGYVDRGWSRPCWRQTPGHCRQSKPGAAQAFRLGRQRCSGATGRIRSRVDTGRFRSCRGSRGPGRPGVLPGPRHRSARFPRRRQGRAPPTSRPLPGTPVCAASSTWVVSCPTTNAVRAPGQPRRGGPGAVGRGRPGIGVAGRGDHHRRRLDVVRDAALRGGPVPGDPDPALAGQPDRPDLHPRCAALSRRGGGSRPSAGGRLRHHGPDTTSYRRLLKTYARVAGKRQVFSGCRVSTPG